MDRQWQLSEESARRYEDVLVSTILGPFAVALVDRATIARGSRVVDVGCGTGAATRPAAVRAGASGRVVGLDVNSGMLAVARSLAVPEGAAPIEWREGDVTRMALDRGSADRVLCAQVLQFVPRPESALRAISNVLVPGGRVAVSVWCSLDENPYFRALAGAVSRHVGAGTAAGLEAAFTLGDVERLRSLLADGGFPHARIDTVELTLRLPALRGFVARHIAATPMAEAYATSAASAREAVIDDVLRATGEDETPFRSLVALATK